MIWRVLTIPPVRVVAWLAVVVAFAPGCAGRQARSPESASASSWRSRGSTLGSDLLRAPRGTTIGPPSLGVDLVGPPVPARDAVERAAIPLRSE
jgi:hypothetical protein